MIVITKEHHYQFKVRKPETEKEGTHSFVYIHDGSIDRSYVLKFENADLRILEGETSSLIQNKSKMPILVNDKLVEREASFSKGIPFIVNSRRLFN